jgi:hypothetical protein
MHGNYRQTCFFSSFPDRLSTRTVACRATALNSNLPFKPRRGEVARYSLQERAWRSDATCVVARKWAGPVSTLDRQAEETMSVE